ncbi:tetratricopeptide repeat protein [Fimbriiglobus ruber]|uniref:TPR repeat protein n=1 Tax=Fimbriiglobus ruber TaxID=1908690 RepID=A0A225DHA2_9BACT|nr:tetratricopeptide repeat protein [Fimbriiglobus ruber]OWK37938.1 TPR repeat protein [Fimbriiglobus ruber]
MEIPAAELGRIRELYNQGRYRQALAVGEPFGPVRTWPGPAARLMAGRLAIQLGAPRIGRSLHVAAFRESPAHLEAVYYHARYRLERFGPLSCWWFLRGHRDWSDAAPDLRGDWVAVHALCAARVRDFDRAERYLAQADGIAPDRAWLYVERSSVLELADRVDEGLTAARRSLDLHPWFRPGVQSAAHLLQRAGRHEEAIELLTEAVDHLESGVVAAQLAALQLELGRHHDAARSLDRYADLSPLMEPEVAKWLAARRADVTYLFGDYTAAAAHARQADDDFYTGFAGRLEATALPPPGAPSPRVVLPIDLAPAATAHDLLARFWGIDVPRPPADAPLVLDGLPDAADRRRFERAGWVTREFTLDLDAAATLVGRGVPFFVTFVEAGFGQHRLVVGADRVRGTVFVADGTDRRPAEAPITVLTTRYRAFGPRCFVAVPPAEANRLDGLTLPASAEYDRLHAILIALTDHEFATAKGLVDALRAEAPDDRLTKFAAVAWGRSTGHPVLLHDALTALLADYPHDSTLVLAKTAILRDLGRANERRAILEAEVAAGAGGDTTGGREGRGGAEPLLMQSLAQMLITDPDAQDLADRLLRRSVRVRPHAAAGYYLLASQRWERQQFADAVDLYRFAACLDDREEQFAEAYTRAVRVTGQAPEALRLFQQRTTRTPFPDPAAVRALYNALQDRDEPEQAVAALGKAIETLRNAVEAGPPTDKGTPPEPANARAALADLLLFRAEAHAGAGRHEAATADLAAARPLSGAAVWHRLAGRVARIRPDFRAALGHLRDLLALDPLSADGHRLAAGLLADTEGRAAARQYLDGVAGRYPFYYPLVKLRAEFLYADPDEDAVAATRALLDLCPHDAWAARQLALVFADRKRHDEALAAVKVAGAHEPDHPSHAAVLAHVHRRADRVDEALAALRDGIRKFPDHELAIFELVQQSRGLKEKKAALRFVAELLHARPHTGDGLLAYFHQSTQTFEQFSDVIDPDEFEKFRGELDRFADERPDLWQAWSVAAQGLVMAQRADEAVTLAREATDRFPLVARVWIDLAEACRAADREEERVEALRGAVAAAPGWAPAVHELAEALGEADDDDGAVRALEALIPRAPVDALAHWSLSERLWQAGRSRDALDRAKMAVRHDPGHDPRAETAWSAVVAWSDRLDAPEEAVELARALTIDRAGDPRAWLRLARCLYEPALATEALSALDKAVALDPRNVEAHDMRAERLAAAGRYEEALAAARPPVLATELPIVLQGRAAWVEARRGNYAAAIPPMQALVAVDPEYVWGWQQLAEWYNDTGRPENYLEAASELVRLRPEHPMSLTMRGEAKLQTGDRDGGKADLRDALHVHPGYSQAAVILFDACLADRETREARSALAVLQEHLAGPEVLVKQLQFAARTGDADGAARAFAELCEMPGEGPPVFLQMGLAEMHSADWGERAAEVLRAAWSGTDEDGTGKGTEFNPWAPIYWLETPDGEAAEPDEKLAACDAVVAAYPTFTPGHDRRAEQLAEMGRFKDAAAACEPPGVGPPIPIALRGRAAWIEAQRGDRSRAIDLMRQLVTDEPDYGWGWRQLMQWYDALGRQRDCLEAADNLVRLSPDDPAARAVRGEARRVLGDHRGAAEDFRAAFDLDPTFDAAGLQLIASQLATDDLNGAARTLALVREHADGTLVTLRAVQVAARKGNLDTARTEFRALTADSGAPRGVLRDAVAAFAAAGWEAEADEELAAAAQRDDASPTTAGLWAERLVEADQAWKVADGLSGIVALNRSAAREAVLTYLSGMAASGRAETVTATAQRYEELLREDDESWARAGTILVETRNFPMAAAWLSDWRTRADCRAWMLVPLAAAFRALHQDDRAEAVARDGIELAGDGLVPADFRAWLALSAAVAGDAATAAAHLAPVDQLGLPDGVKLVLAMAEAVLMVQTADAADKVKAFEEAKDHLRSAAGACAPKDLPPAAARWYRKTIARLSTDVGTWGAKAWALWQAVKPWVREG